MKLRNMWIAFAAVTVIVALAALEVEAQKKHQNAIIDVWAQGKPVFGVYVPSMGQPLWSEPAPPPRGGGGRGQQPAAPGAAGARGPAGPPPARPDPIYLRETGEALAKDPLVDFAFMNLEGHYDASGAKAVLDGLRGPGATHRVSLLVRIPAILDDGPEATKVRVKQLIDMGVDGVVHPENRGIDDAKLVVSFHQEAKADVWSPMNPNGEKIAMIMLEDPAAVLQARQVADMKNFSILACGIGSLGGAFRAGGIVSALSEWGLMDPKQAMQLNQIGTAKLLAEAKRVGIPDMLTANAGDVVQRVKEGFLALLMSGPGSSDAIKLGRAAAGR